MSIDPNQVAVTLKKPISQNTLKLVSNIKLPEGDVQAQHIVDIAKEMTSLATTLKDHAITENDILDGLLFIATHYCPPPIDHIVQIIACVVPVLYQAEQQCEDVCRKNKWCCFK